MSKLYGTGIVTGVFNDGLNYDGFKVLNKQARKSERRIGGRRGRERWVNGAVFKFNKWLKLKKKHVLEAGEARFWQYCQVPGQAPTSTTHKTNNTL